MSLSHVPTIIISHTSFFILSLPSPSWTLTALSRTRRTNLKETFPLSHLHTHLLAYACLLQPSLLVLLLNGATLPHGYTGSNSELRSLSSKLTLKDVRGGMRFPDPRSDRLPGGASRS
ncbi:hypothetical protein BC629DRAFT_1454731 [Irpex lacteus]|nr:hypothetical protein BC629DRAFT_1454731 [Irpex lacteus]